MSPPFMQLYVSDYLGDTRALTTEQHGAYLLLLMSAWNAGGRLPNDPRKLARFTGCTTSRWAKISPEVLAYFEVDGEDIVSPRLVLELEKASEKSIKRANAGFKGGTAKALKDKETPLANATDLPWHSPEPDIIKKDTPSNDGVVREPKKRGFRFCPEEFTLKPQTVADLVSDGFDTGDIERHLARMKNHEYRTPRTDWDRAFRLWISKETPSKAPQNVQRIDERLERKNANYRRAFDAVDRIIEVRRGGERDSLFDPPRSQFGG